MSLSRLQPRNGPFASRDGRVLADTPEGSRRVGHAHFWDRAISRVRLVRTAAGATAAALGSSLWMPALMAAPDKGEMPRPIPGGTRVPRVGFFHVFLPVPDAEPSTITGFDGFVGVAQIQGKGTGKDPERGTRGLLFDVDIRFMKGLFMGLYGPRHRGTFAFIWLDIYRGQVVPENQIHDFNPGIEPSALFWTVPVSPHSVTVNFDIDNGKVRETSAALRVKNVGLEDYPNLTDSVLDRNGVGTVASRGVKRQLRIRDNKQDFGGTFVEDVATIEWSARNNAGFRTRRAPRRPSLPRSGASATVASSREGRRRGQQGFKTREEEPYRL